MYENAKELLRSVACYFPPHIEVMGRVEADKRFFSKAAAIANDQYIVPKKVA